MSRTKFIKCPPISGLNVQVADGDYGHPRIEKYPNLAPAPNGVVIAVIQPESYSVVSGIAERGVSLYCRYRGDTPAKSVYAFPAGTCSVTAVENPKYAVDSTKIPAFAFNKCGAAPDPLYLQYRSSGFRVTAAAPAGWTFRTSSDIVAVNDCAIDDNGAPYCESNPDASLPANGGYSGGVLPLFESDATKLGFKSCETAVGGFMCYYY